jgi:Lectin C-type domain
LYSDREAYLLLAETYLKQGDDEKWLSNWDEYFAKVPDYCLEHAQIARTIAWHFIKQRQWEKAKPYAERAASSGASWALITAGSCAEALGDWSTAEEYFRHNTEAYGNQPIDWFSFCRRTGNGKTDEARQVVTKFIADYDPQTANVAPFYLGVYYAIDGEFDDAYRWLKPYCEHTKTTTTLLFTALVADRLKDSETRDALLLKARCPIAIDVSAESKHPRTELVLLAELLADDLAAGGHGTIDMAEAARRSAAAEAGDRSAFYFLLGEYFDLHEQRTKAADCWKQAMLDSDIDTAYRSLAGARLLDRSIGPDSYLAKLQTPLAKEELNPPPPPRLRHQPDALEFHGHYYKFIPAHLNWDEAKEQAQGLGGVLVCITSEAEQKAVVPLAERKSAWIGGYREEGKWKWASGEPFQFERFNRRGIALDHLRLMPNGRWVGGRNHPDEVAGFICEWEK